MQKLSIMEQVKEMIRKKIAPKHIAAVLGISERLVEKVKELVDNNLNNN